MKKFIFLGILAYNFCFATFYIKCTDINNPKNIFNVEFLASCHSTKNISILDKAIYDDPTDPDAFSYVPFAKDGRYEIKSEGLFLVNFEDAQISIQINLSSKSILISRDLGNIDLQCSR